MGQRTAFVMAVVLTWALASYSDEGDARRPVAEVAGNYSARIRRAVRRGEYRTAIVTAAEYERELLSRYKAPTYEMGLFQSEAEHISFHCTFDTWKPIDMEKLELPKALLMMGFSVLLALEGPSAEERFVAISMNLEQMERRIGVQQGDAGFRTDRALQLIGHMFSSNMGVVKGQCFQRIGDHRVLHLEVATPGVGPDVRVVLLPHGGRVFVFLLVSPAGDITANEAKLHDLIKTASFDYKPEDKEAIAAERAKSIRSDPESLLLCVQRLAALGEYGAAAEDLADLRHAIYNRMPKARVSGDVGICPGYGITLKNPDPDRWRLSAQQEGCIKGILLQDKFSVNEEGIMVGVVDFVMAYGPQFSELLGNEEAQKQALISFGRGAAMSAGQIENERFTTVKGCLAYEAVVAVNVPGVKARIQWVLKSDFAVMVLVLGSARNFESRTAEADRIIRDYLQFMELTEAKVHAPRVR